MNPSVINIIASYTDNSHGETYSLYTFFGLDVKLLKKTKKNEQKNEQKNEKRPEQMTTSLSALSIASSEIKIALINILRENHLDIGFVDHFLERISPILTTLNNTSYTKGMMALKQAS
jgi:hypothetical protein